MGWHFLLQGIFLTRDQTRISCIADGFFTTEPPRKPLSFFLLPLSVWDSSLLLCVIVSCFRDPFHFVNTTHSFVCSKVDGYLGNWHFSLNAENAAMSSSMSFEEHICLFLLDWYLGIELLAHRKLIYIYIYFSLNIYCFTKWLCQFTFSSTNPIDLYLHQYLKV